MYIVKCPVCGSKHTIKNGKRNGIQMYVCRDCSYLDGLKSRRLRTVRFIVEETQELFNDKVCAYTIEFPEIEGMREEDCKTNIDRWIYNLFHMNTTTKPLAFQDIMPVFKDVATEAELAKMTKDEYTLYMDSLDRYRTNLACIEYEFEQGMKKGKAEGRAEGLAEGIAQGKAEGLAEGLAQGAAEATLKNAKAMKDLGFPIESIAKVTGLTIEELLIKGF